MKMKTGLSSDISWYSVGEPIEVDQRHIYPIAWASILMGYGRILGCSVSPEALLIVEPAGAYAVSLSGEQSTLDQILDKVPTLRELVEKKLGT